MTRLRHPALVVIGVLVACAGLIGAGNLFWLFGSTMTVANHPSGATQTVRVRVDARQRNWGSLAPGAMTFGVLPRSGDATLLIEANSGDRPIRSCQSYVEGEMYRVEVTVRPDGTVDCAVSISAITNRLLAWDLLRAAVN